MSNPIERAERLGQLYLALSNKVNLLQPLALLAARLYVGWVFFASGLTKLRDWESTLFLFEEEYAVPFINFEVAAWLGTAGELVLPVLLVLGLGGRFAAVGLSVVNIVAVISLEAIAPAAYTLHVLWGVLLVLVVLWGAGGVSIDRVLKLKLLK
ncbi:MAG: DoxX family membrane protein [Oleispira sp.]